jgi:hypothetical protein
MLKKDYCILDNSFWEACHVCGTPLKQGRRYPFLSSNYTSLL